MFTGLIEGIGKITQISRLADGMRLSVAPPFALAEVQMGESIAVNGACLTVVDLTARAFTVEVSAETLGRTTFSLKKQGDLVNLERALRLGDRLGGHLVTGHVDGVGILTGRVAGRQSIQLKFTLPSRWARYVIEKGSIAVEGISLTVNACERDWFMVNIVPYTAERTTIARLREGDKVNIETDIIGKYVEKLLGPRVTGAGVTPELLARQGFL